MTVRSDRKIRHQDQQEEEEEEQEEEEEEEVEACELWMLEEPH